MWIHHRMRAMDINVGGLAMTIDLMNLVITGDLETAYIVLGLITPDDMTQPYHWFSADRIAALRARIGEKISI